MRDDHQSERPVRSPDLTNPLGTNRAVVTPPIDDVFELLSNDCRRRVCLFLRRAGVEVATLEDLLEALAPNADDEERERLAINLHHRHLPKLDDAGIVDYDPRSNTARYWGQPTVEKWAEHVEAVDDGPQAQS
jgi:serine/threonine protein kinase HipA of HipAB toxin-antitoxin module